MHFFKNKKIFCRTAALVTQKHMHTIRIRYFRDNNKLITIISFLNNITITHLIFIYLLYIFNTCIYYII